MRVRARFVVAAGPVVLEDAVLDVAGGRVAGVSEGDAGPAVDLGDVALIPGQVNAHSHAFQRAIRGRTEYLAAGRPDEDFWSWRERMYATANALDPDGVETVSRMAFLEMALAGVTTVGEFHYLHHARDGAPYADPNELAHRVVRAARDVGLRVALLRVAYHRGGIGTPPASEQRRFVDPDVDTYLDRVASLDAAWTDDPLVTVGAAPHSIRAVPRAWVGAIAAAARRDGRVVHVHACEQRAEVEATRAAYGAGPVTVFDGLGLFEARTTLVHATHLDDDALAILERTRPTVCACPTTERNLGDGFLPAGPLLRRRIPVALGSDSQATIDPFAEMRLVESHERLRVERRNVLAAQHAVWRAPPADGRLETAHLLWPMGTTHGARALGLDVGELARGRPADFVTLDMRDPSLAGATAGSLLTDIVFSASPRAVRDVYVAGAEVVTGGRHRRQEGIVDGFRELMSRLS